MQLVQTFPGPWPRCYALQPGTYRVVLHPGAARSVTAGILCQLKCSYQSELSCNLAGDAV